MGPETSEKVVKKAENTVMFGAEGVEFTSACEFIYSCAAEVPSLTRGGKKHTQINLQQLFEAGRGGKGMQTSSKSVATIPVEDMQMM